MAKVSLIEEETIKAKVNDINYIPGYKIAEEERRKNELERIEYYEEVKRDVENGEFNGADGEPGKDGAKGERGYSVFHTIGYMSHPDESIQMAIRKMDVQCPANYELQVGDFLISSNPNSNGRMGMISEISGAGVGYTYLSELKGDTGAQGIQGVPGETPDLNGYATEQYVDNKIGDIETLLSEV